MINIFKKNNFQEKISLLNTLFKDESFLVELCNLSDNNINKVIDNMSYVIQYVLAFRLSPKRINLERILSLKLEISDLDYLFIPFHESILSLLKDGNVPLKKELDYLFKSLKIDYNIKEPLCLYESINTAIIASFREPSFLFNYLFGDDSSFPYKVGEDIYSHYERQYSYKNKDIQVLQRNPLVKKILLHYMGKRPMIIVTKKDNLIPGPYDGRVDKLDKYFISIPTKFDLIQICANNLGIPNKTFINEDCSRYRESCKKSNYFMYSRFEGICIDENFKYSSDNLTGNPFIDINIVYGNEDYHHREDILLKSFSENLEQIQKNSDITLFNDNGVYEITNGRHRIVYLKHRFDIFGNSINDGEDIVIPAYVSYTYSKDFLGILNELLIIYPSINVIKVDEYDDEEKILIVIESKVYLVNGIKELKDFRNNPNPYLFLINNQTSVNTNDIIVSIYEKIGNRLFKMNLVDIIYYLKKVPYVYEGVTFGIEDISIVSLAHSFKSARDHFEQYKVYKLSEFDIEKSFLDLSKYRKISRKIFAIFKEHPEYIYLSLDDLIKELRKYDNLGNCSDNEIRKAIVDSDILKYMDLNMFGSNAKKSKKK